MTTTTLTPSVCPIEWISGTPALPGTSFTLRELRLEDAPLLLEMLTMDELSAYIRTTPGHGCEPFNIWAHGGGNTSFAIVPVGTDTAVGVVQVRFDENPVMH